MYIFKKQNLIYVLEYTVHFWSICKSLFFSFFLFYFPQNLLVLLTLNKEEWEEEVGGKIKLQI